MKLDKGVDTGPILGQANIRIADWDNTGTLTEKLANIGGEMLIDFLPRWADGKVIPVLQEEKKASYTTKLEKTDGEIDWNKTTAEIWRRVRACQPWPGAYTHWQGKQLKIIEAVPLAAESSVPGRVVALKVKPGLGIETAAGILGLVQLQLEGKRAMSSEEFLRGQRQIVGAVLQN